jgi:hypothetical protein
MSIAVLLLIVFTFSINELSCDAYEPASWHLFNRSSFIFDHSKHSRSPYADLIRKAWNISFTSLPFPSKYLELDFDQAIDLIYRHQHPPDCSQVKYLISGGYSSGFGSEIHVEGLGLAIALELNRVYLPARGRPQNKQWQVPHSICHGKKSLHCYYEHWSNCNYADVDKVRQPGVQNKYFFTSEKAKLEFLDTRRITKQTIAAQENDNVLVLNHLAEEYRYLVPYQFNDFQVLRAIDPLWRYYWWRGVSAAYLYRPNQHAQELVKKYSIMNYADISDGQCVSMYIRHGDKGKEMKLIPFEDYANAAITVSQLSNLKSSDSKYTGTIFLGTETPQVLEEAIAWGKQHNWRILYNPKQLEIFRSKGVAYDYSSDKFYYAHQIVRSPPANHHHYKPPPRSHPVVPSESSKTGIIRTKFDKHRPHARRLALDIPKEFYKEYTDIDYIMMITNLADLMSCNAFVCTLKSNYCRLLDEFRALIAMKASALFADLSEETCRKPPCIGPEDLIDFEFR